MDAIIDKEELLDCNFSSAKQPYVEATPNLRYFSETDRLDARILADKSSE